MQTFSVLAGAPVADTAMIPAITLAITFFLFDALSLALQTVDICIPFFVTQRPSPYLIM
jgi:hypothetical protein